MDAEKWFWLDQGPGESGFNMAFDEALLGRVEGLGFPVLRFYAWKEAAATFGYFQAYEEVAGWTSLRPLIRRPTGGGLVPHERDWTYSIVVPPSHPWYGLSAKESYRRVHDWVRRALGLGGEQAELSACCVHKLPGQCFVGAEQFDVVWEGDKVAGAAQRRRRDGLLIQGSVQPPDPWAMLREDWQQAMLEDATCEWGVAWNPWQPDSPFLEGVEVLMKSKYRQAIYHSKR